MKRWRRLVGAWLVGVGLGTLDGLVLFEFPLLGIALVAGAAILLWYRGGGTIGLGGLATGVGTLWLLVLLRAKLSCDAFNSQPNQGCLMPTVEGYLAVSVVVLLIGGALTLVPRGRRIVG